jgi:hypothetical protein
MSHTFVGFNSLGYVNKGDFNSEQEPVCLSLHSFWGGEHNGRSLSLGIVDGHGSEHGSKYGGSINLTISDVQQLCMYFMKWLSTQTYDGYCDDINCEYRDLQTAQYEKAKKMYEEATGRNDRKEYEEYMDIVCQNKKWREFEE